MNDTDMDRLAQDFARDGHVTLRGHFPAETLRRWRTAFQPLLDEHLRREGDKQNRGARRFYVTLPFLPPFDDPAIVADPTILALVERIAGKDPVMCQLATDTPLRGSDYQEVHRDTPGLFAGTVDDTPSYQLAVNFPLIDVTPAHGPVEIAAGTHRIPRDAGLAKIADGSAPLTPYPMALGDVMIRDVRHLHRGTPNTTDEPRPMVVVGYSSKWYFRPEVSVRLQRDRLDAMPPVLRQLLRFNPVVDKIDPYAGESYQSFAF